ncbi:hypothetical protein CPAR01_03472 [Colletotrichum paranaense]|uniref:Uncharacterized protein n=1 Tax=Colletotrichum paranaense TaxID=1914294 RepID=A0ABQ9T2H4_9PEZI|nr:uncharacterized protein CPAR01_03472 [Colletotrichum paranaense]KAK1545970.1 hypothetical protein CPAR01_03472 [Colletotrichum paranaense]
MTTAVNPADLSASVSRHHVDQRPVPMGWRRTNDLTITLPAKSFAAMLHEVSRWHSILMPPASLRLTACCGRETSSK